MLFKTQKLRIKEIDFYGNEKKYWQLSLRAIKKKTKSMRELAYSKMRIPD